MICFLRRPCLASGVLFILFLNLACQPNPQAEPEQAVPSDTVRVAFVDVTEAAGLGDFRHVTGAVGGMWMPETMGAGGGFVDFDGDGWHDIVLVGGGTWEEETDRAVRKLWLYRNTGTGSFTLQENITPDLTGYGFGITAADYDNDGDEDLYLTTLGQNILLNNDAGTFHDATQAAGLAAEKAWSTAAVFFDADRDGWLDLFVGHYVHWSPETDLWCSQDGQNKGYCTPELYPSQYARYYHNRGDGTFEDRTQAAGFVETAGKTLGAALIDYDQDGWLDLVVANDTDPNLLYHNRGDGTFEEVGVASGIAFDERGRARAGMGVEVGVVDETGEATLFVGNFSNEMIAVYRHLGNGAFLDRAAASHIGRPSLLTLTFGLALFDVDLDGDLDLFAANGHVQPHVEQVTESITYRQSPHLFLNQGQGTFVDVASEVGGVLGQPLLARGVAYADYDHDGDLDLLVTENGGPAHLWRNELPTTPYLRVAVQGQESNRNGIGTRLVAIAGGRRQERLIRTGSSYLSGSEKVATFGMKGVTVVDSLRVYWPSGQIDTLAQVSLNQTLRLQETLR